MSLPRLPSEKGGRKRSSRKTVGSNQKKRPSLPTFVDLGGLTEAEVISKTYRRSKDYLDEGVVEKDEVSIEVEKDELDLNYENNEENIGNPKVNLPDYSEMDHESEFKDVSYEHDFEQVTEDVEVNHPSDLNEEIEEESVEEIQNAGIEDDLEDQQKDDYDEDEQELKQEEYTEEEYSFLPGIQFDEEDSENQVDSIVPEVGIESRDLDKTGKISKKKDPILKPLLDKIKSKIESAKNSRKESAKDKPAKPKKEKMIKPPKEKPLKEKVVKPAKKKKEKPIKAKKEKVAKKKTRQHKQKLSFSSDRDRIKSVIKFITYLLTLIISIAIATFLFKNLYSSYVPIEELSIEVNEESSHVLFDNFRKNEDGLAFTATNKGDMSTQFFFDFYLRTTRTSEYKGEAFSCNSDIVVLEAGGTFEGVLNCEELPDNERYKATIYIIEIN